MCRAAAPARPAGQVGLAHAGAGATERHHGADQIAEIVNGAGIWKRVDAYITEKTAYHAEHYKKPVHQAHPESGRIDP